MAKRKREEATQTPRHTDNPSKAPKASDSASSSVDGPGITLQVVAGSYERVLHGFTATIPASCFASSKKSKEPSSNSVQFVDTFLFEAHASAIRTLALSPVPKRDSSEPPRVTLASGSTDERINLYTLSAAPPAVDDHHPSVPTLAGNRILENPRNRELGSLLHHSARISALDFPSRSKLLSCAEDNTISITRTRDWSVVSTIKAPRPKIQGRPSGDTAPPGGTPSGVNDFAVHPSMKLMLSVGRGEKCMRLWNLVTGKKAGVLTFNKEWLQSVQEGRHSTGEGRRIEWNSKGEEFAVAFEWGAIVFGVDSTPTCAIYPTPRSKLHQMKYVAADSAGGEWLAVSTEDGRIIFYFTTKLKSDDSGSAIPHAEPVAQLGGKPCDLPGRVKDFEIFSLRGESIGANDDFLLVTGNSDGAVRIWKLGISDLAGSKDSKADTPQVGTLLGTYETGNRITCMKAFVMMAAEDPTTLQDSEKSEEESESEGEGSDE